MASFDYFIALDGNGLNGFEGFAGVARLRCDPDRDRWDIAVRFFDGVAGGHALQIAPGGRIGFLGNLSQQLLFFDPETLEERARYSTLRFFAPDVFYASQTHVVWTSDETFITAIGPDFYELSIDDLAHPRRLGAHGVSVPHALKRSPSGRYLFYGAMDHDHTGYASCAGIFDLQRNEARIVKLPATVWHLGVHPTRDVFYAPTQRCTPQGDMEFVEYTIAHFKNYLFEIDGERAEVVRHLAIPKDLPGTLTSDVVVTEDHVLYNACASGAIVQVDLATFRDVRFIDERPSALRTLANLPVAAANLVEGLARVNLPTGLHLFLKALRATRFSAVDGSYGLQRSPCGRHVLSAHRGLNEVLVYDYPSMRLQKRIPFPSIRHFFPEHFGRLADPRLGFHHTTLRAC
ncbi:MAG TPA: hypothetical protein VLT33_08410 [Labilithrix sp.]|nr:hypothetical protein [Labilithrix sp.]